MTRDQKIQLAALGISVFAIWRGTKETVDIIREERIKRDKIKTWEHEMGLTIDQVHAEMASYINSDEFTPEGFAEKFRESQQFLNIVMSQPKY